MTYDLFVEPDVFAVRKKLPGHVRQRMHRAIGALAEDPRPVGSRSLNVSGLDIPPEVTIYRVRMEGWRLVYAINDSERWVRIMGIYRRPPYDYDDLPEIIDKLP